MAEPTVATRVPSFLTKCLVLAVLAVSIRAGGRVARIAAAPESDEGHATHHRSWPMIGHHPADTRSQPFEHIIGPSNVHRLTTKWIAMTTGDVSATPAVADGAVYFGD